MPREDNVDVSNDHDVRSGDGDLPSTDDQPTHRGALVSRHDNRSIGRITVASLRVRQRPSFTSFMLCSLLDIALNVSAGSAAAAVGAQANGGHSTARITQVGAIAGLTKSGIRTFVGIVSYTPFLPPVGNVLRLLSSLSELALGVLITLVISNILLGETSKPLLIAAIVATIPLYAELVHHVGAPQEIGAVCCPLGCLFCCVPCCWPCVMFWPTWPLLLIPLDALGGYLFAWMVKRQGLSICAPSAAAAAGAVYGSITGGSGFFIASIRCCSWTISARARAEQWDAEATRPLLERENAAGRGDVGTIMTSLFRQLSERQNAAAPTRERLQADINAVVEDVLNWIANWIQQQRARADAGPH